MRPSDRFAVVLVRTHLSSNLGSAARAAKNFGVHDLRLVDPAAPADEDAVRLASGADDVLGASRRYGTLSAAVEDFGIVVATSSLRGRAKHRSLDLRELPAFLAETGDAARVAFVFGPEKSGLTEEELARSSATVTIPTERRFPTMNLSHAVAVILATTLFAQAPSESTGDPWALSQDVEAMIAHWDRALDAIGFYDTGHRGRTLRDWRRLVASRPLLERDVAILRGVANRVLVALARREAGGERR